MRIFVLCAAAVAVAVSFMIGRLSAQEFQPSCVLCPSTYIAADELVAYERIGRATGITDQQMRSIDIGKTNLQLALVHRGKLDAPAPRSVAEHDLVSEVYYVISGSGTNVTGPQMTGQERRPATDRAVRLLNGPGTNAQAIRNGATHELEQGDVLVIPAGTGHQFTKIDDHITYLMIRIDPDKVVPLMDEAASRTYLEESRQ
jgi:mannose-6-phosphate isomerase-like protein (cupin superfamily)